MGANIPVAAITDKQFQKGRELMLPVTALDDRSYSLPSASREGRTHEVVFDAAYEPREVSCTCEAGERSQPCWAMARSLDEHRLRRILVGAQDDDLDLIRRKLRTIGQLAQDDDGPAVLDAMGRAAFEARRALDRFEQRRLGDEFALFMMIEEGSKEGVPA